MSLRLRLALWYGGLTGVVVVIVSLFAYATHARAHTTTISIACSSPPRST
ncbi:MAG: hypothetical protein HY329_28060 [Chloroflexi bacterium]|nr:hypothetical protein [Chloroflexota bacterium]